MKIIILGLLLMLCVACDPVASSGLAASNAISTSALATSALIAQLTVCLLVLAIVVVLGVAGWVTVRVVNALPFLSHVTPASTQSQTAQIGAPVVIEQGKVKTVAQLPAPRPLRRVRRDHSAMRIAQRWFK